MRIFFAISLFLISLDIWAQCCSGGSGNFLVGESAVGVLEKNQIEFSSNYQKVNSNLFLSGDSVTKNYIEQYDSKQLYAKISYGLSEKFTISLEAGYFLNKSQMELNFTDTVSSEGISDLVIFPKYNLYNKTTEKSKTEFTVGIGYKIPLGTYNDSLIYFTNPISKIDFYMKKPPAVQPSNGSHDIVFYSYYLKNFYRNNFRLAANVFYIKKGWNPEGEKFGNYFSFGLFIGKQFFKKLDTQIQIKAEKLEKMKRNSNLPLANYDVESTGSKKIFVVPQVSFPIIENKLNIFALYELPVYQILNGTQIASKHSFTFGISYRINTKKSS